MFIYNARIHTMDPALGTIENGYIVTDGDRIYDAGVYDGKEPRNVSEAKYKDAFDASGMIITPGFIDAHCHVGITEDSLGFEGDDLNEITDPVTPHLRAIDAINPRDRSMREALAGGVTAVAVGPGSANPVGGQCAVISTNGKRVDDMILLEPAFVKFALGENPKKSYGKENKAPMTRMASAQFIRDTFAKGKEYIESDEQKYDAKNIVAAKLLSRQLAAHFHAHRADDIFTAIRIAKEFSLDYTIVHCTEGHLIAAELAKEKINAIIGPVICDRSKPELTNLDPGNAKALYDAGILFAICTDHPVIPLHYLPLAAGVTVRHGLPYDEALKAITVNPARILKVDHLIGSITPGKRADFAIFDGDPLSVYTKAVLVVAGGEKI
ncbi:amidohydrolase [Clostridia bacterium]|nr:amidohydrolase [Clostridia bacterium]